MPQVKWGIKNSVRKLVDSRAEWSMKGDLGFALII